MMTMEVVAVAVVEGAACHRGDSSTIIVPVAHPVAQEELNVDLGNC